MVFEEDVKHSINFNNNNEQVNKSTLLNNQYNSNSSDDNKMNAYNVYVKYLQENPDLTEDEMRKLMLYAFQGCNLRKISEIKCNEELREINQDNKL